MPASNHINPYQMKLFYDAHDLMNMRSNDDTTWDDYAPLSNENQPRPMSEAPDIAGRKYAEAHDPFHYSDETDTYVEGSLKESIEKEGIKEPVMVTFLPTNEPILMNGHHRTVIAHSINPNMYVPTIVEDPRVSKMRYTHMERMAVDPDYKPRRQTKGK